MLIWIEKKKQGIPWLFFIEREFFEYYNILNRNTI